MATEVYASFSGQVYPTVSVRKVENGFIVKIDLAEYVFPSFEQLARFLKEHVKEQK